MNVEELETRFQGVGKWEESSIPTAVAQRIEQTLAALPERGKQRSMAGRTRTLAAAVVALVVVGGGIAGYVGNNRSEQVTKQPLASSTTQAGIDPGQVHNEISELNSRITADVLRQSILQRKKNKVSGEVVSDQGIRVQLGTIVSDGYGLSIRYSITADEPIANYDLSAAIHLDGQTIGYAGKTKEGQYGLFRNDVERIDSKRYEGILSTEDYAFEGARLQHADLELDISKIGSVSGKWVFSAEVKREGPPLIISYEKSNLVKTSPYGTLELRKAAFSTVATTFDYRFTQSDSTENRFYGVEVEDDQGYPYGSKTLRPTENDGVVQMSFPPITPETKSLLIKPLYWDWKPLDKQVSGLVKAEPSPDDPFVLPIGGGRQLVVTAIERSSNRTVIRTLPSSGEGVIFSVYDQENSQLPYIDSKYGEENEVIFAPVASNAKLKIVAEATGKMVYLTEMEIPVDLP